MTGEDWKLLTTVVMALAGPTGLGWWLWTYRQDRRDEEQTQDAGRESDVNIVLKLLEAQGQMQGQIGDLYDRWMTAERVSADARADAAAARADAAAAVARSTEASREVGNLRATLTRVVAHFRPVVDWLDAGAPPPPPVVPDDVRELLRTDPTAST